MFIFIGGDDPPPAAAASPAIFSTSVNHSSDRNAYGTDPPSYPNSTVLTVHTPDEIVLGCQTVRPLGPCRAAPGQARTVFSPRWRPPPLGSTCSPTRSACPAALAV